MTVTVNGEKREVGEKTVAELLQRLNFHQRRCATLLNGQLIRRAQREAAQLREGDQVEIISMVGGG